MITIMRPLSRVIMAGMLMTSCTAKYVAKGVMDDVKVITDIEGGNVYNVRRISANHFSTQMRPDKPSVYNYPDHNSYWFYLRLTGVAGKEIRIDLTNCDWMPEHWKGYRPVFTYAADPDDLGDGHWQKVEKTFFEGKTFSFMHTFTEESIWVALRYPYSYTREKRYLESIHDNDFITIEELGTTALGNTLFMIVITDKNTPPGGKKGVLVYAREHGVEQDGSWVAEGMVDFLISNESSAEDLRRNFIFIILPIISPDAVVAGKTVDPTNGKYPGMELSHEAMDSIEARLLYGRMKRFVAEGGNLSLAISLHNPHGGEPNIYPNFLPYNNTVRLRELGRLHGAIIRNAGDYTIGKKITPSYGLYSVGRFARDFGSLSVVYEVNHQAADSFLTVKKLKSLGEVFVKGIADYYKSSL